MQNITLLFLLTLSICSNGQTKNPFRSLKFDKVIMYDYQPAGEDPELVDKRGQLVTTATIKRQVQLDTTTVNQLNKKLGDKKSYGQVTAMCFNPHLGIVYYLNSKIVRHILICMDCNALRADVDIPAQHQDKQGQGEKSYYLGDGMSNSFRQFLNGLLIKNNFSNQIKAASMFYK